MSDRTQNLERKEARRILGERTTSVVGQVREHVQETDTRVADAFKALANAESRLQGLEISNGAIRKHIDELRSATDLSKRITQNLGMVGKAHEAQIESLDVELEAMATRMDLLAAATFRARLRWLCTGKWPEAPAKAR